MIRFAPTLLFLFALFWGATPASAQGTCAYMVTGVVPTAAQWQSCWTAKQDVLGFTPLNRAGGTMTGKLVTATSTTGSAGFNLPQGAAPTVPVNGDVWLTTAGLFARVNGSLTLNGNATSLAPPTGTVFYGVGADIVGTATLAFLDAYGTSGSPATGFVGRTARGTSASPTALLQNDILVTFTGRGYGATGFTAGSKARIAFSTSENWSDTAQGTYISFDTTANTTTTRSEVMRLQNSGGVSIGASAVGTDPGLGGLQLQASWASSSPVTKTGTSGSQAASDSSLIINASGSYTLTLLAAATYPGRWLHIKTIANQTVTSASSNVVPITTGTAGTAILSGTAGKWVIMQSDGTNWVTMASN